MISHSIDLAHVLSDYFLKPEHKSLYIKNGETITVSQATENDVDNVTDLIHLAFEAWKLKGLDLSPMYQSPEQTRKHLIGKGLILKNTNNQIVGTISFDFGNIVTTSENYLFYENSHDFVPYQRNSQLNLDESHFLIFKRLAIHPNISRNGLGQSILKLTEQIASELSFDGILLETVKDATWLYEWYSSEHYQPIGFYTYPSRPNETVLMLKGLKHEGKK